MSRTSNTIRNFFILQDSYLMVQSVSLYRQGAHKSMKFGEKRRNSVQERSGKNGGGD